MFWISVSHILSSCNNINKYFDAGYHVYDVHHVGISVLSYLLPVQLLLMTFLNYTEVKEFLYCE